MARPYVDDEDTRRLRTEDGKVIAALFRQEFARPKYYRDRSIESFQEWVGQGGDPHWYDGDLTYR